MKLKKKSPKSKATVKKSLTMKYADGGKVDELKKSVKENREERPLRKKGGKQMTDADLGKGRSASREASIREAKLNTAAANANIADLLKEYKGLSAEDRKGEKGKSLKTKISTERDSIRGNSKYEYDTATNKQGKVRIISKKLKYCVN